MVARVLCTIFGSVLVGGEFNNWTLRFSCNFSFVNNMLEVAKVTI